VCSFNQVESPEVFGCGAGTQHLYIDCRGNVCPCDFTPLSFGNIRQESFADVWQRMNLAFGDNPRRHCFIQKHHKLAGQFGEGTHPLSPELSEKVCAEVGTEPLPGCFAMVMGKDKDMH